MLSFRVFVICLFLVGSCSLSLREHLLGFDANVELQKHNQFRANHGVGNLILDNALSSKAQAYANKMVSTRNFVHSGAQGENIYYTDTNYNSPTATDQWYKESAYYKYYSPGLSPRTWHFTQLIWKSTLKVGFAFAVKCVVAYYFPPGNQRGKFKQNVPRRIR